MAGQGTIAVELQQQLPGLDAVFVAVGGGGLIGGIGAYLEGSVTANGGRGLLAGELAGDARVPAGRRHCGGRGAAHTVGEYGRRAGAGSVTFDVCRRAIDRSVLVSEDEILRAMRMVLETEHWVIEGAAGVAVAAFLREAARWQGKKAAIVICGRNVSAEVLGKLC